MQIIRHIEAYLRQIILSWLYFLANAIKEGSIIPPRSLSTKCKVDSAKKIKIKAMRWNFHFENNALNNTYRKLIEPPYITKVKP